VYDISDGASPPRLNVHRHSSGIASTLPKPLSSSKIAGASKSMCSSEQPSLPGTVTKFDARGSVGKLLDTHVVPLSQQRSDKLVTVVQQQLSDERSRSDQSRPQNSLPGSAENVEAGRGAGAMSGRRMLSESASCSQGASQGASIERPESSRRACEITGRVSTRTLMKRTRELPIPAPLPAPNLLKSARDMLARVSRTSSRTSWGDRRSSARTSTHNAAPQPQTV